ncbi:ABC1 kinase family protein [Methylomagnum sp.]
MPETDQSTPPLLPAAQEGHLNRESVVRPIPRRRRMGSPSKPLRQVTPPKSDLSFKASLPAVLRRMAIWNLHLLRLFIGILYDLIRLRGSPESRAVRVRHMLQNLGPTAIKIGQQLSIRADVLSAPYCEELAKLLDQVPPFPTPKAIEIIETSTGYRLEQVFRAFDPVPIGSASISCVFQAELINGDKVAVKVRRPGVPQLLVADLEALGILSRLSEALGLMVPGVASSFTLELRRMLLEELDFRTEARYTEIFRRDARECPYVTAPKLVHPLCNEQVLVSEFISGAFLTELLAAIQEGNQEELLSFSLRGFDPKLISKRMLRVFFWEIFESEFFHADPHPANIIVRPDNTFVMIDFGSCGSVSKKFRHNLMQFYRHGIQGDLNGMCRSILATAEPLPPVDVDRLLDDLLHVVRGWYLALQSKHSTWEEKCTGGLFMKMIFILGDYGITSRTDAVRFFRASFLYDSIIFRLNPRANGEKEFKKWYDTYAEKRRKHFQKQMLARVTGPADADYIEIEKLMTLGHDLIDRTQSFLEAPHFSFASQVGKVAYLMLLLVKTAIGIFATIIALATGRMLHLFHTGSWSDENGLLLSVMEWALENPATQVVVLLLLLIGIRKMAVRLDRVEVDGRS